jgi:hypothetical protein
MSSTAYLETAKRASSIVSGLLADRGLEPPARWVLTERNNLTWLLGILPTLSKLQPYVQEDVFHSLSTALGGRPVILSNSTGMRYAILLSAKPTLPKSVDFPGGDVVERLGRDNFALGEGFRGPVRANAREWISMLIAGAPGSGKSTFLRSLAHTARLNGWQLYLVDPDGNTFSEVWNAAAAMPVGGSLEDALQVLGRVEGEIERRVVLFQEAAERNPNGLPPVDLDAYNAMVPDQLPRVALIIDEANTYMGDKGVAGSLSEIARRGRKWGVHIILAGHNWRAKDVSRELSAMLQTRLCLAVADDTSGEVVLGSHRWGQYAMQIQTPGRAVLRFKNLIQPIQTYMVRPEQEAAWLAVGALPDPLSSIEREMVRVAVEEQGGAFAVKKLAQLMGGQASEWTIGQTAKRWERMGWLTAPADAVSPRLVTDELRKRAGLA